LLKAEKWLVRAELMSYLEWLIYPVPFKAQYDGLLDVVQAKYYANWAALFSVLGKEKAYHKLVQDADEGAGDIVQEAPARQGSKIEAKLCSNSWFNYRRRSPNRK
jgi:hypothetical protein